MSLIHLHLLSVGIATVGSVWQKIPSFLLLLTVFSFAPHGLNVAHRLPLDKTVFIIDVAQITQKFGVQGGLVTVALNKGEVPGGCLAFQPKRSCKKE